MMRTLDKAKWINYSKPKVRGAAVVEFALLLILLLTIVAGIVEFGRTFWYYDALAKATRDGARYMSSVSVDQIGSLANASTQPTNCSSYSLTAKGMVYCAAVAAKVPGFTIGAIVVSCDPASCANSTAPQYITVSVAYPVRIGEWVPFVTLVGTPWVVTLSPATTMRYMR